MVTEESLREKYAQLETVDLLEIAANKPDYEELAVIVAMDELKKRNVPAADIANYKSLFKYDPDEKTLENYFIDLNFFQKFLSYILTSTFQIFSNHGLRRKRICVKVTTG